MAISASQIVQVNPRLLEPGANNLEFNGLILSKSSLLPVGKVYNFAGSDGVAEYFGYESEEYKLSLVYFLGYDDSFLKPRKLLFSKFVDTPVSAWLRGGEITTDIDELQAIQVGTLELEMNGHEITLDNLDFSTSVTFSDIAFVLQTALQAQTDKGEAFTACKVEYTSLYDSFIITNGSTGDTSTIDFADGDVATALNLTEDLGAIVSLGSDATSYNETMENILNVDSNWVTFTNSWMPTEEEALGFADWSNSKGVDFLYIYADDSVTLLQPNSEATIAHAMKEENYGSVAGSYNSPEYAVFIMAVAASIDWDRFQSIITTAFKAQQGLPAVVENSTDAINLIAQGMNFVGDYATRNDNFIFHYPGQMFGSYKWIDAYLGAIWMKNQLQASCMFGFSKAGRVPYKQAGYTLIKAWMQDPINRALNNGVIDVGVELSETQKAQMQAEVGKDISREVEQTGYYLSVKDPGANARLNRDSPQIDFYYTYAGSVNRLVVPATMAT